MIYFFQLLAASIAMSPPAFFTRPIFFCSIFDVKSSTNGKVQKRREKSQTKLAVDTVTCHENLCEGVREEAFALSHVLGAHHFRVENILKKVHTVTHTQIHTNVPFWQYLQLLVHFKGF